MNRLLLFLSRITGSHAASASLLATTAGAWPAVLLGFVMVQYQMRELPLEQAFGLLAIAIGNSSLVIFGGYISYGGLQRIGLKPWWKIVYSMNQVFWKSKLMTQEQFFEAAIRHKWRIYQTPDMLENPGTRETNFITRQKYESLSEAKREEVFQLNLNKSLMAWEKFPIQQTILVVWAIFLVTVPIYFFISWQRGNFDISTEIITALAIVHIIYYSFCYINCELQASRVRHEIKKYLKPAFHRGTYSIRIKFAIQVVIIIFSLIALFGVMRIDNLPSNRKYMFLALLGGISIYLTRLFISDFRAAINTLGAAVKDLGSGGQGELFLFSTDKEFTNLGNNFSRTAREVLNYRVNLEKIVEEKTAEISAANQDLKKKDDIMNMELELASSIQNGLLPGLEDWFDMSFASYYRPMVKVSGDFYDVFQMDGDRLGILCADVSGHGIPACLITSMGKLSFFSNSKQFDETGKILDMVNRDLVAHVKTSDYMTAFFLIFDKDYRFQYSNASHQLAIIVRADGRTEQLDTKGFFLGVNMEDAEIEYESRTEQLHPGDRLILYTDGVVEMRSAGGEEYGHERFLDFLVKNRKLPMKKLTDLFVTEFFQFIDQNRISDDITFLAIGLDANAQVNQAGNTGKAEVQPGQDIRDLLLKAKEHFKRKEIGAGMHILEDLNRQRPGDPQILYPLARFKFLDGSVKEAKNLLDSIKVPLNEIRNTRLQKSIHEIQEKIMAKLS